MPRQQTCCRTRAPYLLLHFKALFFIIQKIQRSSASIELAFPHLLLENINIITCHLMLLLLATSPGNVTGHQTTKTYPKISHSPPELLDDVYHGANLPRYNLSCVGENLPPPRNRLRFHNLGSKNYSQIIGFMRLNLNLPIQATTQNGSFSHKLIVDTYRKVHRGM